MRDHEGSKKGRGRGVMMCSESEGFRERMAGVKG